MHHTGVAITNQHMSSTNQSGLCTVGGAIVCICPVCVSIKMIVTNNILKGVTVNNGSLPLM